eukprot:4960191-Amphidinium_carterae.1
MGDHDERQAALLNQTMDEFSTSINDCISQLTVELQQAESSTGTVVTRLRTAMKKNRLQDSKVFARQHNAHASC